MIFIMNSRLFTPSINSGAAERHLADSRWHSTRRPMNELNPAIGPCCVAMATDRSSIESLRMKSCGYRVDRSDCSVVITGFLYRLVGGYVTPPSNRPTGVSIVESTVKAPHSLLREF